MRLKAYYILFLALVGLFYLSGLSIAQSTVPLGVAFTPRNFPNHTEADIDDAFKLTHEVGKHVVINFQWSELNLDIAKYLLIKAKQYDLTPVLGLSPTTLDQGRKELDISDKVRRDAGTDISFSNKVIRKAYLNTAIDLAKLKPPYLCLATEINFLALQRLPEFLHFVTLYKEAYHAVKKISPQTKVFVTFQWEWVRIVDSKEMDKIAEHSKIINIFRPELDIVGLTTYPSPFHETPAQLLPDYYTWVFCHIPKDDPVMLMEIGWPTSGTGDEAEQLAFIRRLPALLKGINLVGIEWALLHDVKMDVFDANLNTVGLRYYDGKIKPGYEAFRQSKIKIP